MIKTLHENSAFRIIQSCGVLLFVCIYVHYSHPSTSGYAFTMKQNQEVKDVSASFPMYPVDNSELVFGIEPQLIPTPDSKFIFFHLRKCGGSALRKQIARSAAKRNLSFLIPCNTMYHT